MNRVDTGHSRTRFGLGILLVTLAAGSVACGGSAPRGVYGPSNASAAAPAYKSGGSYGAPPSSQAESSSPGMAKDAQSSPPPPPAPTAMSDERLP